MNYGRIDYISNIPKLSRGVIAKINSNRNKKVENFINRMNKIIESLPVNKDKQKELKSKIKEYKLGFVDYATFQTFEKEDVWSAALVSIATLVLDNLEN